MSDAPALPLAGKRIVVTRAAHQAQSFSRLLQQQGALPLVSPLIEIVPPDSWQPLDCALQRLADYHYLILTSVNAVDMVCRRLKALELWHQLPPTVQWVCVGPKTAEALEKLGRTSDLQPDNYRAEAVVELLRQRGVNGCRVLYPRAELARELIPRELSRAGAVVDDPIAYRTLPAATQGRQLVQWLEQGQVDVITFTSSSSVENFVALLGEQASSLTAAVTLASIGPLTTATADRLGLHIAVEPPDYTLEGLVAALIDYFNPSGQTG